MKFVTGVDKNIGENYLEAAKNTGETFLTGAAVGSVMQGGSNIVRNISNKNRGGAGATRADNAVANIIEVTKNYNENRDNNFRTDAAVRQNMANISRELVKMTPEARKNYLESIGAMPVKNGRADPSPTTKGFLQGAFNEDGTLSEGYFTWFRNAGTNAPKNQYYSHGIAGKRDAVQSDMTKITNDLRQSYAKNNGVSIEEATQAVPDVKIYEGELTAKEQRAYSKFKEGFNVLNRVGGEGLNFVMVDSNSEINGTIVDGKTVYMAKDTFTNGTWAKTLVHEYTHFAEGSREYERLVKLLNSNSAFTKIVSESLMKKGYGFDNTTIEDIQSKRAEGKELTQDEIAYYEVYRNELNAHLSEELLGNEQFISDIVIKDKSLAAKVLHKIKNLLSSFGTIKDDNAREQHRFLKKAENLYLNAIHRAGYKYANGKIVEDEEKKGQKTDSKEGEGIEFARKKRYNNLSFKFQHQNFPPENEVLSEAHRLAVWWATKSDTETGDQTLISVNYRWYLVEKFDDALNNYQVEELISNEDFEFVFKEIKEYGRSGKVKSISGSTDFIDKLNKSGYSLEGRKSSSNGYETQYGREDNQIQRMGEDQIEGRERAAGDRNGDSQGGSENRQGIGTIEFSRKSKEPTFEAGEGGSVKVNFNDFDTNKSNDNGNDFEAAERARRESLDALLGGKDAPKKSPVALDNNLLRQVVNNTKAKKYTRKEIKTIVGELLSQEGYFGDNTVVMKGKKRAELEKMLWQALNTKGEGELGSAALDAAEYIIQNAIAVEYLEVTDDIQLAVQFVDALKPYLHNMNLDFIKGDIKAKFDKDKTPYLMWAVKKESSFRGYTADEVAQELEALGFTIDKTNEADIFLEINELYRLAKQTITDAVPAKDTLLNALGTKKAKKLKQALARDILNAQEEKGTETSFYKLQQKYIKQIAELGEKVKTAHKRNTLENRILKEAKRIADSNKHTFANATEVQTDALKNIKKLLSRVNSREQVNRSTLRAIMKELAIWYSEKNPVLQGFYDNYIAEHLAYFAETESAEAENGQSRATVPMIEISPDSELLERIKNSSKSKYDVIKEYLIEKFYGERFVLSDGKSAIMDKRDANKLSAKANTARTTQLGNLKEIVEKAVYSHSAENIEHDKFSKFEYYGISVKIGEDTFNLWLNVGTAKNDGERHIYALTNKKEEAPTKNGVSRPVGNAIQNASSTNIIPENSQNVKREKPLSISELESVYIILHHINHVFENFGKMWRGGKYVEASDVAEAQYNGLVEAEQNISSFERVILHNKYVRYFMDPMAVLAAWDGHDPNGYFTTTYREFAEGLINQRYDEMRALEKLDKLNKKGASA